MDTALEASSRFERRYLKTNTESFTTNTATKARPKSQQKKRNDRASGESAGEGGEEDLLKPVSGHAIDSHDEEEFLTFLNQNTAEVSVCALVPLS